MQTKKRNDGTFKQDPPRLTRKTRNRGSTKLLRDTKYKDDFDAWNKKIKGDS